ncbi:MAG: DNA repair protein RecO [Candidatus Staskawiczbacteria bacterium]|jgi:DNA repair protein RecO (recombination protein O)
MTTKYKTQAIIFEKNNINEFDRIFSVFTNSFGKLDIFAKAIRKIPSKLRSGIDTFFLSEIEFVQGKSKKTLTDAVAIERFNNIFSDIEKLKVATNIREVLNKFIKGEERDSILFDLLIDSFYRLNSDNLKREKCNLVYYYFLWNTLSILGYHPEVNNCAGCHGKLMPDQVYFSGKDGGVICAECVRVKKNYPELYRKINSDVVKILRIILLKDWQTLFRLKIELSTEKLLLEISEDIISKFCPNNY